MSLYDKYHSPHNKNHMYRLITDIIQKEYNVDVQNNQTFRQFFETNFINTFQVVSSEELTTFNRHLLDTQINYYRDFISKVSTISTNDTKDTRELQENQLLHSYQRTINLTNSSRHNYRIKQTFKGDCLLEKLLLPIEDTPLFMNPVLILMIDTKPIELHMRGTIQLRDRTYGIYTPFFESPLQISSDTVRVQFRNQVGLSRKGCDVYSISENQENTLLIECDKSEFNVGDVIRLCNLKDIELTDSSVLHKQYTLTGLEIRDSKLALTVSEHLGDVSGLFIMNMSLQNTLHFIKI